MASGTSKELLCLHRSAASDRFRPTTCVSTIIRHCPYIYSHLAFGQQKVIWLIVHLVARVRRGGGLWAMFGLARRCQTEDLHAAADRWMDMDFRPSFSRRKDGRGCARSSGSIRQLDVARPDRGFLEKHKVEMDPRYSPSSSSKLLVRYHFDFFVDHLA